MTSLLHAARMCCLLAAAGSAAAAPNTFADPIATPARLSERAVRAPVFALAEGAGGVRIGVGPRGHILRSTDGRTWAQVPSPVSTDLVAVSFAGPRTAWAVGHDGVMLQSSDAGASWHRRMDGFALGQLLVRHYEPLAAARPEPAVQRALDDARKAAAGGAALSLLSVWFRNEREGFVAGQFNLLLHTADGGASWQPWLERTENPDNYSLHAIAGDERQVWIAGELGLLLRLVGSGNGARFQRVESPYQGSWFGMAVEQSSVLLFGLRGNAWRSDDGGARWRRLATGTDQAINAGVMRRDGSIALLTSRGRLLAGGANDNALREVPRSGAAGAAYALLPLSGQGLALGTAQGVQAINPARP
ncbi:MAG TPA: YCF48-related protein [Burkholderiaceae bacterium]|nr:YCF48-related protein [Burkholderiaceae bacterium]